MNRSFDCYVQKSVYVPVATENNLKKRERLNELIQHFKRKRNAP